MATVYSLRVEGFVDSVCVHLEGCSAAGIPITLDDAIDYARKHGQEYMDSAQLAEGEKRARRRLKTWGEVEKPR